MFVILDSCWPFYDYVGHLKVRLAILNLLAISNYVVHTLDIIIMIERLWGRARRSQEDLKSKRGSQDSLGKARRGQEEQGKSQKGPRRSEKELGGSRKGQENPGSPSRIQGEAKEGALRTSGAALLPHTPLVIRPCLMAWDSQYNAKQRHPGA